MAGRPWTDGEMQFLRKAVGEMPYPEIANRIRRSVSACRQRAVRIGLYVRHPYADYGPAFGRFLREKNAEGWSDAEIADAWPGERHAVSRHRKLMQLPDNAHHPRQRAQWSKMPRDQCAGAGVKNLAELRVLVWRQRATRQGWPADCTPLMCQVLGALEYGPRTRREMCAALGRRYHPKNALKIGGGQTVTAALMRKGYVVAIGRRAFREGQGNTEFVYALARGFRRRRVSGVG